MSKELTIVVPAYNEEQRLARTVEEVVQTAVRNLTAFEVILVDDGSTDGTPQVADELARKYPWVSVVHHRVNQGVGAAYYSGLERARYPYLTLVPGDNAFGASGLEALFKRVGAAELVVSYRHNPQARTPLRRLLSCCCTLAMRFLTGCPIRDAHSLYAFPVHQARQLPRHPGYGYHIETLAALLRGGLSYVEVPVLLNPRPDASSKVMRPRVLMELIFTMARLYVRYLLLRRPVRFSPSPTTKVVAKAG